SGRPQTEGGCLIHPSSAVSRRRVPVAVRQTYRKEGRRPSVDAKVRRQVATGTGSRDFGRSHPVNTPEFILIIGELDELLATVQTKAGQQRDGFINKHPASVQKRDLERRIREVHLPHIQRAGQRAARDNPQLLEAFPRKPATTTFAGFRTVAGG